MAFIDVVIHRFPEENCGHFCKFLTIQQNINFVIAQFVFNFPLIWKSSTESQNTRLIFILETKLKSYQSFQDSTGSFFSKLWPFRGKKKHPNSRPMHPSVRTLHEFARLCVLTFRMGRTHMERINFPHPSPHVLRSFWRDTDVVIPSQEDFDLALDELHRLGSLLYTPPELNERGRPRTVALFMALHPRLGVDASLNLLDESILWNIAMESLIGFDPRE